MSSVTRAGLTRVFLVDDHAMFRSGVRSELAGHVEVVGEAEDVEPAIKAITECVPTSCCLTCTCPVVAARPS